MIGIVIIVVLIFWGVHFTNSKKKEAAAENDILINDVILENNIVFFRGLNKNEKQQFENELRDFLSYIRITGVNTPVDDLDRIFVAASAVIPVFAFPGWKYSNLREVLLYSDAINNDFQTEGEGRNIL